VEGSDHGLICDAIYQHLPEGLSKLMINIMIAGLFAEI
jgi:hypothetical protein